MWGISVTTGVFGGVFVTGLGILVTTAVFGGVFVTGWGILVKTAPPWRV